MNQEHLDAEVVAAWAEGSLDPGVRAVAEAHAADCDRCQAVLAAMVRTEPIAAAPKPAWFRSPLRWMLPIATAAAALTLWVVVSRDAQPPPSPRLASRTESTGVVVDRVAPREPASSPAGQPQPADARQRESTPAEAESTGRAAATLAADSARKPAAPATPPAPLAETIVTRVDQPARVEELRRDALMGGRSTPPAPGGVPSPQTRSQAAPQAQQQRQQQTEVAPQSAGYTARKAVVSEMARPVPLREFASPDLTARWRIGASGAIQRSTDGGQTWTSQKSGVTTELIAGSAPLPTVCWIVGRSGVVLVSADATTWRRVPFPVTTDLRAVSAIDASTASVTTAEGRVFRTIDGGVTWAQ